MEEDNKALSICRQGELLGINRHRLEAAEKASGVVEEDLELAREIDQLHLRFPEFGSRRMSQWLRRKGDKSTTWRRVGRVMKAMGVYGSLYINPGSPWENGHIERFHNKLHDEYLNREIFGFPGGSPSGGRIVEKRIQPTKAAQLTRVSNSGGVGGLRSDYTPVYGFRFS